MSSRLNTMGILQKTVERIDKVQRSAKTFRKYNEVQFSRR